MIYDTNNLLVRLMIIIKIELLIISLVDKLSIFESNKEMRKLFIRAELPNSENYIELMHSDLRSWKKSIYLRFQL